MLPAAEMRTVHASDKRLIATRIPWGSWLVRVMDGETSYDQMIVVTPRGRLLHLMGWIGSPTSIDWRAARDALWPRARRIRWERLRADGSLQPRELRLPPCE